MMFEFLYPTSFLIALVGLIMWFYFKGDRKWSLIMRTIFFGGLGLYFVSLFFAPGLLVGKLFALFRDLLVMGGTAQFFNYFRKNKMMFFGLLAVLIGTFQFGGRSLMLNSLQAEESVTVTTPSNNGLFENGEILAELKPNIDISTIQSIIDKYNLSANQAFNPTKADQTDLDDFYMLNVPSNNLAKIPDLLSELRGHSEIESAEYNELLKIDPIITKRKPPVKIDYGINDPFVDQQWGFKNLSMDQLYKVLKKNKVLPKKKARIFIVDSGVDARHEDLQDRYTSTKSSYDSDSNGHGTHCAGIAAAITNNGKGIASVFPSNDFAEISSIKVMNAFGLIPQQRLISGIIEAVDNGADVISVSIGARSRDESQKAFQKVVEYANKANAIIVVAAGNSNLSAINFTPANADGVITVSAIDTLNNIASFSNSVDEINMGIAAPGVNIYSTFPGSNYKPLSGTSMACPQVSGLIGLMRSINPDLSTREAFAILKLTGQKTGATEKTGPLVNPAKAVEMLLKHQNLN